MVHITTEHHLHYKWFILKAYNNKVSFLDRIPKMLNRYYTFHVYKSSQIKNVSDL